VQRRIAIGVSLLLAAAGTLLAADELPKAETILDKYVQATGGKAAYLKVHNEISTGSMELAANGIKGHITVYRAEPELSYTELDIEGVGKIQEGSDGKIAWSLSALQGPRLKEGDEKASTLRDAKFQGELNWRDNYKQAKTVGVEQVDGKDCYKVELTPNEGSPVTRFYDKESGLLVKTAMTVSTPMGEIAAESVASDYRKEGDILVPHKMVQKAAGQEMTFTIESVKYNSEIPKDRFATPDEIKALMKK